MIPISDNIPSSYKPIMTYVLIGINIAVFLWEITLDINGQLSNFVNSWGVTYSTSQTINTRCLSVENGEDGSCITGEWKSAWLEFTIPAGERSGFGINVPITSSKRVIKIWNNNRIIHKISLLYCTSILSQRKVNIAYGIGIAYYLQVIRAFFV